MLAIAAIATAGVSVALRDGTETRLEREAQRLAALLEAARAQSQVSGVPVRWRAQPEGYSFEGLTAPGLDSQGRWLDADTRAEVRAGGCAQAEAPCLLLGPDALGAAQALTLYAASAPQRRVHLVSDGVHPFAPAANPSAPAEADQRP